MNKNLPANFSKTKKRSLKTALRIAFCLFIVLQISAKVSAQQVTIKEKNTSLAKLFATIQKQTGLVIFYNDDLIKNIKPVTINLKNASLNEVLNECLKGTGLNFTIVGNTIVIKKAVASPSETIQHPLGFIVHGFVTDSAGKPLANATINLKSLKNSSSSPEPNLYVSFPDTSGKFEISGFPGGKYAVTVTYIGYAPYHQNFTFAATNPILSIVLHASSSQLDQIQIIAYGKESKRLSVGAVNSVSAKDLANQPVVNPLLALEGLVPGLNITPTSGAPGSSVKVQIRGQNTLSTNPYGTKLYDQPLFIVDGVPIAAQNLNINTLASLGSSNYLDDYGGSSPINNINPADIENISILKDAAATSIYGTQGANGVILITTKKGKAGKTKLEAVVNRGFNFSTRSLQLLNLQQYLNLRKEAVTNDGVNLSQVSPTDYPDLLLFDQNKNTDWYKFYEGKNSNNTDAHLSLSGGSDKTTFIISGGYTRSDYNFPGNFADNRLTLHSNIHNTSANNRLSVDFGFDYSYDRNNSSGQPTVTSGILTPPNYPNLLNTSGNLNWNYKGFDLAPYQLLAYLRQPNVLQNYNMNNSFRLDYKLMTGLDIGINMGYSRVNSIEAQQFPASTIDPTQNPQSFAAFSNSIFQTINIEPQLNYEHEFGKGQFTALLGGTYKKNTNSNTSLQGYNYNDESLLGSIGAAGSVTAIDTYSPYKYVAGFARLGYIYDQKYIVQVSGRRDGSSNFGPGRQFGNFGAIGIGWIFSDEQAFKTAFPFISYGKLSSSYGTTGSDGASPYNYQQFFSSSTNLPTFQGTKPLVPLNLYNPDYSWDTKKSLNIGLDLGFLNDRFLLNINYYQDRIGDQLINYTLPSQTGFSSVFQNFNAVIQNRGLEFSITSKNVSSKDFSWSTNFNISGNRNKLLSFPGLENSPYANSYTIGKTVNIVKGYRYKDVNPTTGVYEFYKADGTVTYNPVYGVPSQGGDFTDIANTDPKFTGGLGNTINYKNFSLYFMFQFEDKIGRNYLYSIYSQQFLPGGLSNEPTAILEHWKKPGDNSSIEKVSAGSTDAATGAYNFIQSSGIYSDASYIRLKTLALSYTLPANFLKKINAANFKVYVNAQNLFLLTGFKVGDPELTNIFSFPLQRTVVLGISLNY